MMTIDGGARMLLAWAGVALMAAAGAPSAPAAGAGGGSTAEARDAPPRSALIVVGRVSPRMRENQPRVEAMADWLARRLAPHGIRAGAGLIARDNREMIRFLRAGKVDLVSETPLTALHFAAEAGAEIVLREWKRGRPTYRSVLFTRRGSDIHALEDLRGRRIAFEDRGSTSSFLLPMAVLRRAGLSMVKIPSARSPVPAGRVGYVFAGSEINISAWTALGRVEAGAYSDRDWDREARNPKPYRDKLRIFHFTAPLLRSVAVLRAGIPPRLRKVLLGALLEFGGAEDARRVRKTYYGVRRYDPIEGDAAASLAEARRLYRDIRDLLE